ncbi:substrate-binding periplasmic protein [Poseidonibacter ostreae]|uniref:Transporter substrate-binding domain-containing protein n=1 Tax=Poseidonibacter ostreae TaxID=2654171 RepID=A0A6L4WUX8_9BACT|nr:ABC transporter substrate-binding protein [Poseidonibacter ostreae]KAB7889441.1 transporter substrate-binding domain-containing protein [Poseidonibacter ostreae]KAB7892546.1 transporter substrate-binding domain-containing protein [Poseidonibacter ostreae]MAC83603.1 amino acid ABC transporter substrate-binding protein [Arcobacter sp.]|tara:strand:+ start:3873 stop:4661 length:789 start_codon:yes stop_codon:yes gene_type:complete
MKKLIKAFLLVIFMNQIFLFAESKLDIINKNNELKVCIWPQYYGISYVDPRTQKLVGIDSDLAIELAKDLGVKLKLIKSSFPTLINDVTSNKCNIAMFAIGNTKSRRAKMRFTTPHLQSDIYAITTKTNTNIKSWDDIDKKGIIVAVAKGTYHEPIMKKKLKNAELVVIKGFKQREDEVQSGRVDVFMTDYPYSKKMLEKTDWAKLISPKETYHLTPYAWTMAYGDDKFYERVEKFIRDINRDGRLLKIAKKNALEPIIKVK